MTSLERTWHLLGLQFITVFMKKLGKKAAFSGPPYTKRDLGDARDFKEYILAAKQGMILNERRRRKLKVSGDLNKLIEAERAFRDIQPVLPVKIKEANDLFQVLIRTCDDILKGADGVHEDDCAKAEDFYRRFIRHLDAERGNIVAGQF